MDWVQIISTLGFPIAMCAIRELSDRINELIKGG